MRETSLKNAREFGTGDDPEIRIYELLLLLYNIFESLFCINVSIDHQRSRDLHTSCSQSNFRQTRSLIFCIYNTCHFFLLCIPLFLSWKWKKKKNQTLKILLHLILALLANKSCLILCNKCQLLKYAGKHNFLEKFMQGGIEWKY